MADENNVVFRHIDRNEIDRNSRPESAHKGNLKRLKTSSVSGFQRWEKENELLWAMLEDETEWLAKLFPDIVITPELFFYTLEDGVVLCRLANLVQQSAEQYGKKNKVKVPSKRFKFHTSIPKKNKQLALFKSRENVQGFLTWCRQIGISDSILFESNDVVEADECREGCREVVICLMEIARRASGMFKFTPIPKLIQLEKEIEIEEQEDAEKEEIDQVDYASSEEEPHFGGPNADTGSSHGENHRSSPVDDDVGGKKKNRGHIPKSELDKEVLKIIDNFNFYNIRKIKEGKYMILGKIIFVRMLNGHVLLRIGGGWDTLEHYLLTHLPKFAASENGHSATETVEPSVSKTPQKSQLTKILDKAKKEQQLRATPSPYRPAGVNGSESDEEDDEKDITNAIRKIELSVNQNIATRRKNSRHLLEETPQKSPTKQAIITLSPDNTCISEKNSKSKSLSSKDMDGVEQQNEITGEMFTAENDSRNNVDVFHVTPDENNEENMINIENKEELHMDDNTEGSAFAKATDNSKDVVNIGGDMKSKGCEQFITSENEQRSQEIDSHIQNPTDAPAVLSVDHKIESNFPTKDGDLVSRDLQNEFVDPKMDSQISESNPDVTEVNKNANEIVGEDISEDTAQEFVSSSTTPEIPQTPAKSPSPTREADLEKPDKTKTRKPGSTKSETKKEPVSSTTLRPKSAKASTRPDNTMARSNKKPTVKSSTSNASKTKLGSKASSVAATVSGKPTTGGRLSGKSSSTHSTTTVTSKPESKASTKVTSSARPVAFGSTASSVSSKKPTSKSRPAPVTSERKTTANGKVKTTVPKVQSWSSTTSRPQSGRPTSKPTDSAKDVSKERPTSPAKSLVRKTQTRTVTTTKTTRVGDGKPEIKSQTMKTTRTTTEANGKKTTKTTVKELTPTGRKPLRMTTEKTEPVTGSKKSAKLSTLSKTGAGNVKTGTSKTAAKLNEKTDSEKPSRKKTTSSATASNKHVKTKIKEIPKGKTVKELSNALGITKPLKKVEFNEQKKASAEEKLPVLKSVEPPESLQAQISLEGKDSVIPETSLPKPVGYLQEPEDISLGLSGISHQSKDVPEEPQDTSQNPECNTQKPVDHAQEPENITQEAKDNSQQPEDYAQEPDVTALNTKDASQVTEDDAQESKVTTQEAEDTSQVPEDDAKEPDVITQETKDTSQIPEDDAQEPVITRQETKDTSQVPEDDAQEPVITRQETKDTSQVPEDVAQEPVITTQETKNTSQVPEDDAQEPDVTKQETKGTSQVPGDDAQELDVTKQETKDTSQVPENDAQEPVITTQEAKDTSQVPGDDAQELDVTKQETKDTSQVPEDDAQEPVITTQETKDTSQVPGDDAQELDVTKQETKDTSQVPENDAQEPVITTQEAKDTSQVPGDDAQELDVTKQETKDTSQVPEDDAQEPVITTQEAKDTSQVPEDDAQEPVITTQEAKDTSQVPGDDVQELDVTKQETKDTSQVPEDDEKEPDFTTQETKNTSQIPEDDAKEPDFTTQETKDTSEILEDVAKEHDVVTQEAKDSSHVPEYITREAEDVVQKADNLSQKTNNTTQEPKEISQEPKNIIYELKDISQEPNDISKETGDIGQESDETVAIKHTDLVLKKDASLEASSVADSAGEMLGNVDETIASTKDDINTINEYRNVSQSSLDTHETDHLAHVEIKEDFTDQLKDECDGVVSPNVEERFEGSIPVSAGSSNVKSSSEIHEHANSLSETMDEPKYESPAHTGNVDESVDVIIVPEGETSREIDSFPSTEAWGAVEHKSEKSTDAKITENNNVEIEEKLDSHLILSMNGSEDDCGDQNVHDFNSFAKSNGCPSVGLGIVDDSTNADS